MNNSQPLLALVVPCYNEQEVILESLSALRALLKTMISQKQISSNSYIVLVDDGSTDNTYSLLQTRRDKNTRIIKLAHNVGHQAALLAGLHYVTDKVDCSISIDADLQDDIEVMPEMVRHFCNGKQIVYGVRSNRDSDTLFKKGTASLFYQLMQQMGVPIIDNHADFRLVSNTVLKEFGKYKEVNLFLRGIFPQMGYPSSSVAYSRKKRNGGESKYPLWKMMKLAANGITSFTNYPLKIITNVGMIVFAGSLLAALWVVYVVIADKNVPGWASITLPIYFLGGIQLLSLGIIGEYISRIYLETKQRPFYHIEEIVE
ncbi:MAG: glycosyltransferase family 2 protein [Imperialibacter sp.]